MTPATTGGGAPAAATTPPGAFRQRALFAVLGAASVAAAVIGQGNLAVALAPLGAVVGVLALYKAPLRATMVATAFMMLISDPPGAGPAGRLWFPPSFLVGKFMGDNLNNATGIRALGFSGCDLMTGVMTALLLWRWATNQRIDPRPSPTPRELKVAALISLAAWLVMWAWGLARGGDFRQSLWQVQKPLYLPLQFFLIQSIGDGKRELKTYGWVLAAAAFEKGFQAIWFRLFVDPSYDTSATATNHSDSILFAATFVMIIALNVEKRDRRSAVYAALGLPILAWAMVANNRRLAWVEIGLSLALIYAITPWSSFKRRLARAAVIAAPIALLYVAAGWNSSGRIFKPVQMIQSVVSAEKDRSTLDREVENDNLLFTMFEHQPFGTGWGHEYHEVIVGDDISQAFPQYKYLPHNSVLGFFVFGGPLGFAGIMSLFAAGVFFATRAYRAALRPGQRAAALSCLGIYAIFLMQGWGDLGMQSWVALFTLAPTLVASGRLALDVGAWPAPAARPRAVRGR